ncbi:MAG: glycosyltransferase family 4 protein [Calditrichaeota bacterium]|nr:glycosyltransferase family 4 protein [Calditrichota bacterium]MCB0312122.1 glycosyltransferase family 4 protein [Calditrichota bacterium]
MNIFYMNSVGKETWGGVEKWMLLSARGLRDRGHRVHCCGRPDSLFLQACAKAEFSTFPLDIGSDFGPGNIARLAAFFRRERIDAIIANLNKDVRLAGVAGWFAGRPALLARAGLALLPNNWKYRLTYKALADGIITNTNAIREKYLSYHWLEERFVRVIYNGIDTESLLAQDPATIRKELDLPEQGPVIGIFGRLVPQKQHTVFLEVAKNILNEWPDALFLIVGDGPRKTEIQQYASDLGIIAHLYMTGFREEVMPLYQGCDVVLLTSAVEGLPNVVMEAMLAGRAVVAFDVGGVHEVITSPQTGRVVPPNDIYLMTQNTLELLAAPETRREIGDAARSFIRENFSLERMVRSVEAYLEEVVAEKRRA